jgi:RsiW-degrading membrane proteinase PrsW (M82 family)
MEIVGLLLSIVLGIVPMVIFSALITVFDRYEKEPLWLMIGVFAWGAIVAAGVSLLLNTLFGLGVAALTGSAAAADVGAAVISAPLVEETAKGLAVLIVFVYFRHEFDSILDGIIYGSLVGYGFAATENINYIFNGFAASGLEGLVALSMVRIGLIPFLHGFLTSLTGIGFAVGRLNKGVLRFGAPALGYGTAVFAHALHNLLASSPALIGEAGLLTCFAGLVMDWVGFFGMFGFMVFLMWREGRIMRDHLKEEVALGALTERQYLSACSLTGQLSVRWGALGGQWNATNRFYDLCGELAFKKYQLAQRGPERERDAPATIAKLREAMRKDGSR